jgi:hypothetical protein
MSNSPRRGESVLRISHALGWRSRRRNNHATFLAYLQFCRLRPAYHACIANQIHILDWIDERRIEMLAEGRPHWVPSERDFEQAMRDCWDDLVKRAEFSR